MDTRLALTARGQLAASIAVIAAQGAAQSDPRDCPVGNAIPYAGHPLAQQHETDDDPNWSQA